MRTRIPKQTIGQLSRNWRSSSAKPNGNVVLVDLSPRARLTRKAGHALPRSVRKPASGIARSQ